jgi:hypothetical protein
MSGRQPEAGDEHLPKATTATRLARKLGLTDARARLIASEIERQVPGVRLDRGIARRLAVFPRLGVVYNRIQKNANTTTMLLLDALEVGRLRSIPQSKGQHLLFYKAWALGRFSLENARYMVVVRSPYSRALSSFLFKFRFMRHMAMPRYGREFDVSPQGFEDFLAWLGDGALSRDLHWDLQLASLALPASAFTDIIHVERYEAEMRQFLLRTRLGSASALDAIDFAELRRLGSPHASGTQDKREDFMTPRARRRVADIYAKDFQAFGYDPG